MKEYGKIILIVVILIGFAIVFQSCSLNTIIQESYLSEDEVIDAPDIDIDEDELESLDVGRTNLKKVFDSEASILSDLDIRDPFKPFYITDSDEEKNMFILESIYTQDQKEYAELLFNDVRYRLTAEDVFQEIYLVKSINVDSIVLLKGDEVLTLYLNQMILD